MPQYFITRQGLTAALASVATLGELKGVLKDEADPGAIRKLLQEGYIGVNKRSLGKMDPHTLLLEAMAYVEPSVTPTRPREAKTWGRTPVGYRLVSPHLPVPENLGDAPKAVYHTLTDRPMSSAEVIKKLKKEHPETTVRWAIQVLRRAQLVLSVPLTED